MTVLLFLFAAIGLTHILVDSTLLQSPRDWLRDKINACLWAPVAEKLTKMMSCYQCMGFWCGLAAGWCAFGWKPWTLLLCGWASSFLSMWGAVYLNYLEANAVVIPTPLPSELPKEQE